MSMMPIKYGSVCSGIEAPAVAFNGLGFKAQWFSELDPFRSEVLAHHYPDVPNLGDMTKIRSHKIFNESQIDLLIGGTPCQSFSECGKRAVFDDPRGLLTLEFINVLKAARPKWFVWENVTGVLKGRAAIAFKEFTSEIVASGYSLAWRVFDAQDFGLAQTRKRVFVVGHFGACAKYPAQVLFDPYKGEGLHKEDANRANVASTDNRGSFKFIKERLRGVDYIGCLTKRGPVSLGGRDVEQGYVQATMLDGELRARRLMPIECERLQGFPDDYTKVSYKGKPIDECSDNMRINAVGDSMPVPVLRYIAERLVKVNAYAS